MPPTTREFSNEEILHLARAVELAEQALAAGDQPFGSVLVSGEGEELAVDRNRAAGGDRTQHPEFNLARWAAANLTPDERARATVYTSGEHCPMCAAAHAWVGLGPIVYVGSTEQMVQWHTEAGLTAPGPVAPLPINQVAPDVPVRGPVPDLLDLVEDLHRRWAATRT